MDKVWFITMLKKERNLINQTKKFSFNHAPMRRGDKRSNYPMSHQNPTICEYRFMHQIRKILSNIGTSIASLEYACWAVVRMLYMFWGTEVHRASVLKTLGTEVSIPIVLTFDVSFFFYKCIPYTKNVVQLNHVFIWTLRFFSIICLINKRI